MIHSQSEPATLSQAVVCTACGYDLRSLPVGGVCPECGQAVVFGSSRRLLRHANGHWISHLLVGMTWLRRSRRALLLTLGATLLVGIAAIPVASKGDTPLELLLENVVWGLRLLMVMSGVGLGISMWFVFSPEPSSDGRRLHFEVLSRVLAVVTVPAIGIWSVLGASGISQARFGVMAATTTLAFAIVWTHVWLMIRRASSLEERTAGMSAHRQDLLALLAVIAPLLAGIVIVLFWVGPLRWWDQGMWSLPSQKSMRMLLFLSVVVWLGGSTVFSRTGASIGRELTDHDGQAIDSPRSAAH